MTEGALVLPTTSTRPRGINAVHDRLYRAALRSRERVNAAVRLAEQACIRSSEC